MNGAGFLETLATTYRTARRYDA